ncbi:MAG: tRNA (adenosine(37)-N6)-dimethylallyltransferase MiaA [Deltaproteobacteria bacterium CG17_big_fil_post_rev_8_21_14_2_50_63_7]|nr:MAG: tRNA (adenosine(37)-N6)-dimethylallyltransferase MiaA [Deltaproteobacteria bacterium CG17_big_fil_post_rev_8_21_14_2_50_63_7]
MAGPSTSSSPSKNSRSASTADNMRAIVESSPQKPPLILLVGPTASGKTRLAVELAEALPGEVINADSMQVFRGLDVGTDKPSAADRARVRFHAVDIIDPGDSFDAARFAELGAETVQDIHSRGKIALAAGGTGLYQRALRFGLVEVPACSDEIRAVLRERRDLEGVEALYDELRRVDPETAARIHSNDWVRVERALEVYTLTGRKMSDAQEAHGFAEERFRSCLVGCARPRELLYQGIEQRLDEMWSGGLIAETEKLLSAGLSREVLPLKALGYRHAAAMLCNEMRSDEALEGAKRDTKRFAKRQLTWYRKEPGITWLRSPLSATEVRTLTERLRAQAEQGTPVDWTGLPVEDVSTL